MKKFLICLIALLCLSGSAGGAERGNYTPPEVMPSVYQLKVFDKDGDGMWSGTGWIVKPGYMMTAGHVCHVDGPDAHLTKFRAYNRWGQSYPVKPIKISFSDSSPDLCLMEAKNVPGDGLDDIAPPPKYWDKLWYVGAPHGVWGEGTAPAAEGHYIGGDRMMIAGYPGASGSPVFTKDGIVGILVRGWRGTHLIEFETADEIKRFLAE